MAIWKLKSCPRCGGDVFLNRDEYNWWYEQCLQCGCVRELKNAPVFTSLSGEREEETALAGETQLTR